MDDSLSVSWADGFRAGLVCVLALLCTPEARGQTACGASSGPDVVIREISGLMNVVSQNGIDALVLGFRELNVPSALSILLQGDAETPSGISFGDGIRCAAGALKRLFVHDASGGTGIFPAAGDPSISAQSAALGDPIAPGSTRIYQTYYRDPDLAFCSSPPGNAWNVTNALRITW